MSIWYQVALSTADTTKYNVRFERYAINIVAGVQVFHVNDGVFTEEEFMNQFIESNHKIRFSGAGVVHHNGFTESLIKIVVNMSCTMMLHDSIHSPEVTIKAYL